MRSERPSAGSFPPFPTLASNTRKPPLAGPREPGGAKVPDQHTAAHSAGPLSRRGSPRPGPAVPSFAASVRGGLEDPRGGGRGDGALEPGISRTIGDDERDLVSRGRRRARGFFPGRGGHPPFRAGLPLADRRLATPEAGGGRVRP